MWYNAEPLMWAIIFACVALAGGVIISLQVVGASHEKPAGHTSITHITNVTNP